MSIFAPIVKYAVNALLAARRWVAATQPRLLSSCDGMTLGLPAHDRQSHGTEACQRLEECTVEVPYSRQQCGDNKSDHINIFPGLN